MIYRFLTGRSRTEVRTFEQSNEECRSEGEPILKSDFVFSIVRLLKNFHYPEFKSTQDKMIFSQY